MSDNRAEAELIKAMAGMDRRRMNDLVLLATVRKHPHDEIIQIAALRHWRKIHDEINAGRA